MGFDSKWIVLTIVPMMIGAYVNDMIYKRNNERLLEDLKAELQANNQAKARMAPEERVRAEVRSREIEAQIKILNQII